VQHKLVQHKLVRRSELKARCKPGHMSEREARCKLGHMKWQLAEHKSLALRKLLAKCRLERSSLLKEQLPL
jgi:hypothetical protein